MILGREKEIVKLNEYYDSDESSFIAIYGRRRVGKTFLINHVFEDKLFFKHTGIFEGGVKEQITAFYNSLIEYGYKESNKPINWFEAFECLKQLIRESGEKKKVIFLDEIAWMYTKKSNFLKALEFFWNGWANSRKDIMLIICSSATSWIINQIIHSKGGLYNRITKQIYIEPFTLEECEKFIKYKHLSLNRKQIIEIYMVIGGIPYYWDYIEKGMSVPQFIDSCFFSNNAPLRNEFKNIFSSLFSNPNDYIKIIEALSTKNYGLTRGEIVKEANIVENGELSNKLEDLVNCGFIRVYSPFNHIKKSVIYQLMDPLIIFHFHFLNKDINGDHYFTSQVSNPLVNTWKCLAFERICFLHSNNIKKALGISGVNTSIYP